MGRADGRGDTQIQAEKEEQKVGEVRVLRNPQTLPALLPPALRPAGPAMSKGVHRKTESKSAAEAHSLDRLPSCVTWEAGRRSQ